jgi:hypothetical protein
LGEKKSAGGIDPTGAAGHYCFTDCLTELVLKCNRNMACGAKKNAKSWVCSDVPAKMMCSEAQAQRS